MPELLGGLTPRSKRQLLDFMEYAQRNSNGGLGPAVPPLPPGVGLRTAIAQNAGKVPLTKAELLNYARYLRKCQSVRIADEETRSRHKVSWWAPTPRSVVVEALKLADLSSDDVIFDLGCGDGRVVVDAARIFGATAIGFEINMKKVVEARRRIANARVADRAGIRRQSILAIPDLYKANVVYLYLTQAALAKVVPVLKRRCRKGTRLVSVDTWINSWAPAKTLFVRPHHYQWRIGVWQT